MPTQPPSLHRIPNGSAIAALVLTLDAAAAGYPEGCNAHVFPDGAFQADDGRPASMTGGKLSHWQMSAAIAAPLIAAVAAKPVLYDYEHGSLYGDSKASGWIDRLVHVPGRGLFAHVAWTPDGAEAISKKEYRYSSPLFRFDEATGAVTELLSVTLTNIPGLPDLGAVGLARRFPPLPSITQDPPMADENLAALSTERDTLKTQVAALTTERDTLKTQVAALTTERDTLQTKVADFERAQAEAALAAERSEHATLLAAALSDGRLIPAQKAWAEKQPLAALKEYLQATDPLAILQRQREPGAPGAAAGLTAEQLAMCTRMGVKPEDFVAAKSGQ